jgi:hypothetical protein
MVMFIFFKFILVFFVSALWCWCSSGHGGVHGATASVYVLSVDLFGKFFSIMLLVFFMVIFLALLIFFFP